ncbi:MAG: AMP-binding protein [Opitutales bacterium]|nr:AMP-binding protein [Opitutales bacterium]
MNCNITRFLQDFEEIDRETAATAALLRSRGIARGMRTLLMLRPGPDLIRCTFALFRLGAVPVAIDPGMGIRHFCRCVANTRPEALVGVPAAQIFRHLFFRAFKTVKIAVTAGTKKFSRNVARERESSSLDMTIADLGENDLAAILFTSGSTGAPKGVHYTHGIFDAQQRIIKNFYKIVPGEIDMPLLPVFSLFDPAFGMTTVTPEMNPAKPATLDPAKIVKAVQENRVSNSFGAPVLWRKIAEYCEAHQIVLPTIKRILCAGTAVPPATMALLKRVLPNAEIHSPYGATETLPVADITADTVLGETGAMTTRGYGTCTGTILPEVGVKIVPATNEILNDFPVPAEKFRGFPVGEICVNSPTTTRLYDNNEAATRLAKITDRDGKVWHRMGDLGYIDEKNRLWFLGRKAELVRVPAGTFYTESCEAIFNTHPAVSRSALIEHHGVPAIVVELKPFARKSVDEAKLKKELRDLAAGTPFTAAIERFFIYKKTFPCDVRHNAKIHRLTLRKYFA